MDGPPNPALPKLTASTMRLNSNVDAITRHASKGLSESAPSPARSSQPPEYPVATVPPAPKTMTLGQLAASLSGDTEVMEEFNPAEYLRARTPQKLRSGAGLAAVALGRMHKRR